MKPDSNRLTESQREALQKWLLERVRNKPGDKKPPQRVFAKLTKVSQGQISKLMIGENTTFGTARDMIEAVGEDPSAVLGIPRAIGRYKGRGNIPMRGDVLEALSVGYDTDFLDFVQAMPPPAGSDRWTFHQWMRHVVAIKDLYDSGVLGGEKGPDSSIRRPGKHA